jgi:hypothetical protein
MASNDLINYYQQLWNAGNYKDVYDATQGSNKDITGAATSVVNSGTQSAIATAVQQQFGTQATPAIINEAINSFVNSGNYTWTDLPKFLSNYGANPAFAGQATGQALAQKQQTQQVANVASLTAPNSQLYQQYFGNGQPGQNGGLVGAQEQAWISGMKPQQDVAQQKLNSDLAARGLATSGALTAGEGLLNKNYTDAMNQAFQNLTNTGTQNLYNQASGVAGATNQTANQNLQAVTNSMLQQQQNEQAQQAQNATKNASGWSWLQPVSSAIGTIAGGPIGNVLGNAIGGMFGGGLQQKQQQQPPNYNQANYGPTGQNYNNWGPANTTY